VQSSEVHSIASEPSSAPAPGHEKTVIGKTARPLKRTKIVVPLDIVVSLLRPGELEKLQRYVAYYLGKR